MSKASPLSKLALISPALVETAALTEMAKVVDRFPSSDELLVATDPYDYGFYVVGGDLGMQDGLSIVRLLRRRSTAGIVAWRARAPGAAWLDSGADAWLPSAATLADLIAAVRAVDRRITLSATMGPAKLPQSAVWRLDVPGMTLESPDGIRIDLSGTDVEVLSCFIGTDGRVVLYETLLIRLGQTGTEASNWLQATIYRVRRRIERAIGLPAPLSARARIGYEFRGRLVPR